MAAQRSSVSILSNETSAVAAVRFALAFADAVTNFRVGFENLMRRAGRLTKTSRQHSIISIFGEVTSMFHLIPRNILFASSVLLFIQATASQTVFAENRVALVIGQS